MSAVLLVCTRDWVNATPGPMRPSQAAPVERALRAPVTPLETPLPKRRDVGRGGGSGARRKPALETQQRRARGHGITKPLQRAAQLQELWLADGGPSTTLL